MFCLTELTAFVIAINLCSSDPRYKEPTGNFTIFELDEKITKLISQPELGKGDELYQAVYTLHLELLEIHDVFNWYRDCPKSFALGKEIVKRSGLKIFKTFINEESLKDVYKYNNAQVYEIVDLITNCERLYNASEPIIKQGDVN
uniref:Uncharacterized protein n=1 Tax=Homalodisca liturata TaxID=320908 RepID=A0A1B6IHY4_9HEMI